MPRANRHSVPGHIWHITHRCHQRDFLLKFARDRRRWRHWLFQATKRYKLCVLNYVTTSNHIHLLVQDQGQGEIARSMQLIAGRTGWEYNKRKGRKGAFWEDRYHAVAIDSEDYLARCMTYIDLNMVRAGVVDQPGQWDVCGYREIQDPPKRFRVIDVAALLELLDMDEITQLQRECAEWAADSGAPALQREGRWSDSVAVGGQEFVEKVRKQLRMKGRHKAVEVHGGMHSLRELPAPYTTF